MRKACDQFTKATVPLPAFLQVMLMCRGLNPKYAPIRQHFKERTLHYNTQTPESITE